jgi:hypothetical protein
MEANEGDSSDKIYHEVQVSESCLNQFSLLVTRSYVAHYYC